MKAIVHLCEAKECRDRQTPGHGLRRYMDHDLHGIADQVGGAFLTLGASGHFLIASCLPVSISHLGEQREAC
jgi:hypothetical protein